MKYEVVQINTPQFSKKSEIRDFIQASMNDLNRDHEIIQMIEVKGYYFAICSEKKWPLFQIPDNEFKNFRKEAKRLAAKYYETSIAGEAGFIAGAEYILKRLEQLLVENNDK